MRDLLTQLGTGAITSEQFHDRFERARYLEIDGTWWSIDADGATWLRLDGATWRTAARPSSMLVAHRSFVGHSGEVTSVSFSADGTRVATAGDDGSIRVWDLQSGSQLGIHWLRPPVRFVRWLHADRHLLYVEHALGSLGAWDTVTQQLYPLFPGTQSDKTAISADGRILAATEGQKIRLWDVGGHREISFLIAAEPPITVDVSPDGALAAAALATGRIQMWDLRSWSELPSLTSADIFNDIAFSPDSRRLAAGGSSLVVWDSRPVPTRIDLPGHSGNVWCVSWLPSGPTLVSGSSILGWDAAMVEEAGGIDRTVRTWSLAPSKELCRSPGLAADVSALAVSRDGRWIVSATSDGSVTSWAVAAAP